MRRSQPITSSSSLSVNDSLRMPAEWEPHAATWLAWPHYRGDWPGKFEPIPWVYAEIIRNLSRYERVEVIVNNTASEKKARQVLKQAHGLNKNVRFHRWPTDRVWTRDSGCTFVEQSSLALHGRRAQTDGGPAARLHTRSLAGIKWRFNAWAKYSNWKRDEKIGSLMAEAGGAEEIRAMHGGKRVVLEGGSIDVNGRGTLLTTEECLLSKVQQRNPGMAKADYEKVFGEMLGIRNVIWLGTGIAGDDTHGHVDDLTRFVSADTVVTVVESDPKDANYGPLRENVRRLREASDQDGRTLGIVELPMPKPVYFNKVRLPASYANFYIANRVVLVPVFNDANDRVALDILGDLFPEREVVGIYCGDLVWGFGTLHCMTQQQPASD